MPRVFLQYDVFTSEPLTGNQLAVFPDGRGLSAERMQAIAREMNFSESTFILPAEDAATDVRMRIFTPGSELPMAGHPTIGSTFALAELGVIAPGRARFVFGLNIGPTPVDLEWNDSGSLRFAWMSQRLPQFGTIVSDRAAVAGLLSLSADDLHPSLPVQQVSCGVPYALIPLRSRGAVDRVLTDIGAIRRLGSPPWLEHGILVFALTSEDGAAIYSRMLAPQIGIPEDPATGSAAGPLGSYLVAHGAVRGDAQHRLINAQGVHMQRPSRIHIDIGGDASRITSVRVGGEAVLVARGELLVE